MRNLPYTDQEWRHACDEAHRLVAETLTDDGLNILGSVVGGWARDPRRSGDAGVVDSRAFALIVALTGLAASATAFVYDQAKRDRDDAERAASQASFPTRSDYLSALGYQR